MAPSKNFTNGLAAPFVILIFSVMLLPSKPVGLVLSKSDEIFEQRKHVLGSRPPLCVNKCWSCRPCMATLVIPPHMKSTKAISEQEDESYYLLSWKCRCGNKFFQP
ncbi:EPIDERMAL PATTERNING FACTOR-like protein 8 [Magnolia sinica]|uniref:EPIDERMAL PATTERNING FACTOR-like protein 8 n=1 Tax=Magnolia sinica TaxID=86752 RepID=UPI0026585B71|nr:EPIDERMAL PATTERNING FACTOR-like protein 8 [Magnolia sinica]